MLTYKKVLEVFKDYLAEDESCEVLTTSQGYLVVDWNSRKSDSEWVTSRLCQTPEHLRDVLRSRYEEYQGYKLTGGYKREVLPSEDVDIRLMGGAVDKVPEIKRQGRFQARKKMPFGITLSI